VGAPTGATQDNVAFVAMAMASAVGSNDTAFCHRMWEYGVKSSANEYYPHSLHVLGLRTALGNMGHPLLSFTNNNNNSSTGNDDNDDELSMHVNNLRLHTM